MEFLAGPPSADQFELSLFGPGKGESLVVHLGQGQWGIIDSCRHPVTNDPVPLTYLDHIGVSTDNVKFIFASHWNDDHTAGLAETLEACPVAEFGCSAAYTGSEFEALAFEYPDEIKSAPIQEMRRCIEFVEAKPAIGPVRQTHTRIAERSIVWEAEDNSIAVKALAPTQQAIARAESDIAGRLLPAATKRLTLGRHTPNRGSVVLAIEIPGDSVLLGGDLEEAGSGGSGWSAVVARLLPGHRPSTVFKVPHHGSATAHYDGQWTRLLQPQPVSVLTSFGPSRLPRLSDVERILERSCTCYVAGEGGETITYMSRAERNAMAHDGVTVERPRKLGHVRIRQRMPVTESSWNVEFSEGARRATRKALDRRSEGDRSRKRGRRR